MLTDNFFYMVREFSIMAFHMSRALQIVAKMHNMAILLFPIFDVQYSLSFYMQM